MITFSGVDIKLNAIIKIIYDAIEKKTSGF